MGDARPALDVFLPARSSALNPLIDALLDDFHPFAIEEIEPSTRRIHFFTIGDRDRASRAVEDRFSGAGITTIAVAVPDEPWAERSQAALRAIRVGEIVVAPPWDIPTDPDRVEALGDARLVIIRPSMGFGTGHHASTRLCLRALQALSLDNRTVLDIGTGSGVLAITAAKLGAASVIAVDNDRDASDTARDNVALNSVSAQVQVRNADFREARDLTPAAVVLANLSAAVVCAHTTALIQLIADRGTLVVGGVTGPEEPAVRAALDPSGEIVSRYAEDEWRAITLKRIQTR